MVLSYTVEEDSFKTDKPRLWSGQQVVSLARGRSFNLHPDGEPIAVALAAGQTEKLDQLTFIFNVFDECAESHHPRKIRLKVWKSIAPARRVLINTNRFHAS